MIVTGLLGYEHILPVYFALAIPWMSSPSGRDSLTKAVLLPRANQSSVSVGTHPVSTVGCRSTCFPLGNHSSYPSDAILRILPFKQGGPSVPVCVFTHHKSTLLRLVFMVATLPTGRYGANGWNRTTGLPLMRRTFLPSELHGHMYAPYVSVEALAGFLLLLPKSSAHN